MPSRKSIRTETFLKKDIEVEERSRDRMSHLIDSCTGSLKDTMSPVTSSGKALVFNKNLGVPSTGRLLTPIQESHSEFVLRNQRTMLTKIRELPFHNHCNDVNKPYHERVLESRSRNRSNSNSKKGYTLYQRNPGLFAEMHHRLEKIDKGLGNTNVLGQPDVTVKQRHVVSFNNSPVKTNKGNRSVSRALVSAREMKRSASKTHQHSCQFCDYCKGHFHKDCHDKFLNKTLPL